MAIRRLRIDSFRNLQPLDLTPGTGANLLLGPNGAGKTSLIEAIALLGRGRSFRTHRAADCITHGAPGFRVVIERESPRGRVRLGLERTPAGWKARLDGHECRQLVELSQHLPLAVIEPDLHLLISGGPRLRRRYLDWGLFHVEPDFLGLWQQHERALRQYNHALRTGSQERTLDSLAQALAPLAERLHASRAAYVECLAAALLHLVQHIAPGLSGLHLALRRGWPENGSVIEALRSGRDRDRRYGHLRQGAHRDELAILSGPHPAHNELSRGQQKLAALLLLLTQLELWRKRCAYPPLVLIDDPLAELDRAHQERILTWLKGSGLQFWLTAADWPAALDDALGEHARFHVEQGRVQRVV